MDELLAKQFFAPLLNECFCLGRKLKKRREGKLVEVLEGHEGGINCLGMSVDESILITGSEDCSARVWAISEDSMEDKCLGVLE